MAINRATDDEHAEIQAHQVVHGSASDHAAVLISVNAGILA